MDKLEDLTRKIAIARDAFLNATDDYRGVKVTHNNLEYRAKLESDMIRCEIQLHRLKKERDAYIEEELAK